MTSYLSDCENNNNPPAREISIILAVLESGNSIELPASGYSMFPALRPGYRVIVKPLTGGVLPEPGTVVVYNDNDVLRMHRLVKITFDDKGNPQFISRGDSRLDNDRPWTREQFLGVAVKYKDGNRFKSIKVFVPWPWRIKFNFRLVWVICKMKSVIRKLGP
jgi:signal peptidase I